MPGEEPRTTRDRRLLLGGALLFLLGLVTGLIVPKLANPRMALSAHLEAIMNGFVLILLGLIWPRLKLPRRASLVTFWLALYGTYANWATTLLAAIWGAGSALMPLAGGGHEGTPLEETVIRAGLYSLTVAMLATFVLVVWGLRGVDPRRSY